MPITLKVLGPVNVSRTDSDGAKQLLTQPRRLAILAYLTLARPRGLHSRDTLVALLWPESDQAAGRHALRNTLHAIRQALGDDVIVTAGDGLVGVDPNHIECDALDLEKDLAAGRVERAVTRYNGELLQGFHVSDAPEFERWLDAERRRFGDEAVTAAWSNAERIRETGNTKGAVQAARRAMAIAPDDEPSLRRFLQFLDSVGDRATAIRAYEDFATRLRADYDAEPSAETQALVRSLREKPSLEEVLAAAPSKRTGRGVEPLAPPVFGTQRRSTRNWIWGGMAIGLVVFLAVFAASRARGNKPEVSARRLVVLPMENSTGDPKLDYIATGIAEGVAQRLRGIGGITIRSGARAEWPASTRHDIESIGRQLGSTILLKTTLSRVNDSLDLDSRVVDLESSAERRLPSHRFTTTGIGNIESEVAASVAGAVFRVALPEMPQAPIRTIDPESYRLMLEGWHQLLTAANFDAAKALFLQATTIDPLNARAWSGLSSSWTAQATQALVPFDEGFARAEAAATRAVTLDSLQGTAWANLAFMRALKYRSLSDGIEVMKKAVAADPSNPEVFLVKSSMYRHAWQWNEARDALRIARQLDPLSPLYVEREAVVELCAGHPDAALNLFDSELTMSPSDKSARLGRVRTLAFLGRYDDAITAWRNEAAAEGNGDLAKALSNARGSGGYWSVKHLEGERRLKKLTARANTTWTSPLAITQAQFGAGEIEKGYASLAAMEKERDVALYRLPCMPDFDEVRKTPRFAAIVQRVGGLPLH
ncbi:MAG: BTAD domain-containing putative transcriptional regulator [Gemmatimonadaceae bacterium]